MSRDVIAIPVEASTPAGGFQRVLLNDTFQVAAFITRTGHILDVEEGLCADVPHSRRHQQRHQPPAEEGDAPAEGGVGQEQEGGQQQQRPAPGHFNKIPGRQTELSHNNVS